MKQLFFFLILFVSLSTIAQNNNTQLLYLKLKTEYAPYPGKIDFDSFKKALPEFQVVIKDYNISDIKCVFKSKSQNIQSIYYLRYPISEEVSELIRDLEQLEKVEYAEEPMKYSFSSIPNDPEFTSEQWNLTKIQVSEAWDVYNGGTGYKTKIAIIDAGFIVHEDLWGNFWQNDGDIWDNGIDDDNNGFIDDTYGWDAANDDNNPAIEANETDPTYGHGTFVSGFAAAVTNNGIGIASVSHNNAEIIPIKVGKNNIVGDIEIPSGSIPYALDYAMAAGAEIVSMSLSAQYESDLGSNNGRTMHQIVQEAQNMGIIMLAATGNNANYYEEISYPALFPEVIAVGSTDENDYKASSSQYSESVDIMAPGHLVFSTIQADPWYQGGWSGTSFSTPTVAGALALMKSFLPTASNEQLVGCLYSGTDDIESIGGNTPYIGKLGHGRLNIYKSMLCMEDISLAIEKTEINPFELYIYPNPANNFIVAKCKDLQVEDCQILDLTGKIVKQFRIQDSQFTIQISDLQNGIYFIKVGSQLQKFIKQN